MKNVLITGATGMVGNIVLQHCLESFRVTRIISLTRRSSGINHPKLKEIIVTDFTDFSTHKTDFEDIDIAYFCLGVYSGTVKDALFKQITVDYTRSFIDVLHKMSPEAHVCFLSGAGADQKEKSRMPFAKYKGMAENYLMNKDLESLYIFRPGYIYPVAERKEPNSSYKIMRKAYPLLKMFGNKYSIRSTELGLAIFNAGFLKGKNAILENKDILALTGSAD